MRLSTRNWLIVVVACLVLDRFLKLSALGGLHALLLGPSLAFTLFKNTGIAFSLPLSGPPVWILSLAILVGVGLMASRDLAVRRFGRLPAYAFFLVGAISNLYDRVRFGFTVDYLIFFQRSAVNIADGMILFGACWLLFSNPPSSATVTADEKKETA